MIMDMLKKGEDLDEYWKNTEDFEMPSVNHLSNRLVEGINIKDLCDGKEVVFELSKEESEYYSEEDNDDDDDDDDDICNDIVHVDSKTLRENRGAPPLNIRFKEIANKMTNVTEDGLVKKQIVTPGMGKTVSDNAYVTVHYNFYKENCEVPFDSTYLRNRAERFKLGQGEVILGLEYAVRSMKKNENSMFFIKWEVAFGALGCPDRIEKKCDIVADVTLINFVEVDPEQDLKSLNDFSKIDFSKYISNVKKLQCNGSDEFSKGETKNAISCYKRALRILNSLKLFSDEEEKEMLRLKMKCLINLAVCYNKVGKPEQSCLACQEALSIEPNNAKANFHYGRANLALSNFQTAKMYLLRADKLKPNDKEINMELKKLNDKKALYELKDKMFWTKAFEGEEKKESLEDKIPSSLKKFEKDLMKSLEESLKEEKPYILPTPLQSEELKVCESVAEKMEMKFESHPHFCIFKNSKNNSKM